METEEVEALARACREALNDDLNTPVLLAHLFEGTHLIYSIAAGARGISEEALARMKQLYGETVREVLGLKEETTHDARLLGKVIDMLMDARKRARQAKDWATSDRIRDELKEAGIVIKDTKDGYEWRVENH